MLGSLNLVVLAATCVVAALGAEVALRGERRALSAQGTVDFQNDYGPKLTLNTNKGAPANNGNGYQMTVNAPPVLATGGPVMTYSADCYWGAGSNSDNDDDQADVYYTDPNGNEYHINAKAASCGFCLAPGFDAPIV